MDSGRPPTIDPEEFLDLGLLQEVNRQFFHPRGLALAVSLDDDGRITGVGPVFDFRDDPEGVIYGEGELYHEQGRERARRVEAMLLEREDVREDRFGFVVQPDPRMLADPEKEPLEDDGSGPKVSASWRSS